MSHGGWAEARPAKTSVSETFRPFGAALPPSTAVLQASFRGWLLVPLVVVAAAALRRGRIRDMPILIAAGIALGIGLLVFMVYACDAPILDIARTP